MLVFQPIVIEKLLLIELRSFLILCLNVFGTHFPTPPPLVKCVLFGLIWWTKWWLLLKKLKGIFWLSFYPYLRNNQACFSWVAFYSFNFCFPPRDQTCRIIGSRFVYKHFSYILYYSIQFHFLLFLIDLATQSYW